MTIVETIGSASEAAPFDPTVAVTVAATVALVAIIGLFVLVAFAPYLPPKWEEKIAGSSGNSAGGQTQAD